MFWQEIVNDCNVSFTINNEDYIPQLGICVEEHRVLGVSERLTDVREHGCSYRPWEVQRGILKKSTLKYI